MSSSVFIESSSRPEDTRENANTSDANLVVVYGKNGISFDDKGLENLIEEKKISSISVIRLTSPTRSMQDEEEETEKLEEMLRRQEIGSGEDSFGSEHDGNSSSDEDKNDTAGICDSSNDDEKDERQKDSDESSEEKLKQRKLPRRRGRQPNVVKQKRTIRRRKRERPEIVGLRIEEFYPPEDAKEIIKEALKMAGLESDKKNKTDYDFQLFVIKNDHCYTPFTSPTQMKAKLAADKLEVEKQAASRKSTILPPTAGKQLFVRKKLIQQNINTKPENSTKVNITTTISPNDKSLAVANKFKKDDKDSRTLSNEDFVDDDDIRRLFDENDDDTGGDDESDLSGTDESAETDNDRDSDLDFDVNNPKGRKRKAKLLKTQRRSLGIGKGNQKTRRYCSQDDSVELLNKTNSAPNVPTCNTSSAVHRQKPIVKILSDPGRITVRSTPSKIVHKMGSSTNVLSPVIAALPPIPKKHVENKIILNATNSPTSVILSPKTFVLVKGPIEQKSTIQSSPQTHKEIIINKQVMSSPKTKGFTDLTTLIEQTEKRTPIKVIGPPLTPKSSHTATITSVVTLTPSSTAALKGFMPIETAARNQLPAQISIQTHQSSSELEAEHDKQLDLINSIVENEMQKSNEKAEEQITNINENIPKLVKMLESTEKVLVTTNTERQKMAETQQNINQLTNSNNNNGGGDSKPISTAETINIAPASVTSSLSSSNNLVGGIDITSASLLATPEEDGDDNDLPDDILQQVVELIKDDKTLQEAVEKQVFGSGVCSEQGLGNNMIVNENPPPLAPISQQPVRTQEISEPSSSKSIIQMSISNVSTSLGSSSPAQSNVVMPTRTTITTPSILTTSCSIMNPMVKTSPLIRKEPIQIIRGNGRVITLPPIEAPTTRAKRRAQAQPTAHATTTSGGNTSFVTTAPLSESSLDSSMHSNSSMTLAIGNSAVNVQEKKVSDSNNRRRGSKENNSASGSAPSGQKTTKTQKTAAKRGGAKANAQKTKVETDAGDSEDDDDDPNKLWCICRQPHNNRFMICCDVCEDWFHGTCVSITKAMGLEMEQKGIDWTCPKCIKKQEEKKQPKITEMLIKKPSDKPETPVITTSTPVVISSTVPSLITSVIGTVPPVQNTPIANVTSSSIDILNITPKKDLNSSQHLETTPHLKLKSGQIINLKDYSTTTSKRATIIQTSTSNTPVITAGQKKLFVTSGQANLKMSSQPGAPLRTITVVKQLTSQQQGQHPNIKIIKAISSASANVGQSVNINVTSANATTTTTTKEPTANDSSTLCIVCKKVARSNSIYCSDDCIRKHAQNALNNLMNKSQSDGSGTTVPLNKSVIDDKLKRKSKGSFEEILSAADRKPKVERVNVYERKSGRVITGNSAPTTANLKKWLQDNPTFEVIQPGSTQALDLEKKQKLRIQQCSSPITLKTAISSPPPLKMFSSTSGVSSNKIESSVSSSQTQGHSSQGQIKTNKNITDYLKTNSTSPRPSTPKQLQKYPQQVSIKHDKVPKSTEESKMGAKEKTTAVKRQASTESANKGSNNDGEPIRLTVRRTLKEQLLLRIKEENVSNSSMEAETKDETPNLKNVPKLTEEEVEEFSKSTELEMYNYFNRDTGTKYKAKYRSLVFNIKDRKNHTLFAKICGKLIEPKQLVRMSHEEMASQELAQWREQEAKHQLEMIKKSELDLLACAKNYVLKTHKGEEVIEGKSTDYANVDITIPVEDVVSALNKSDLPDNSNSTQIRKETLTHWSDADSSLLAHSHLLLEVTTPDEDKTKSSSTNLKEKDREKEKEKEREKEKEKEREKDKDKDKGRDREHGKRHKSKDRHHDKSRSRKRSHSRSRSRSREKSERRHRSSHKDEKRVREDRVRTDKERVKDRNERDSNEGNEKKSSSLSETRKSTVTQSRQSVKKHHEQQKVTVNTLESYNLIDKILESTKTVEEAANLVSDKSKEKESETYRKTSITPQPVQTATSTVTTSSSSADSAIVIDIQTTLNSTESDQEPSSTVSIPTPPHDPYSRFIACSSPSSFSGDLQYTVTSIWTGNVNMVDVTSFQLTLQPITGNSTSLTKLLPKELDVVGRIGPETVWDYISKIKKSPNKEIVVIRLIPANETETQAYKILYEYLDNRNRLGVIKSTSSQIKDFYIYPLGAGKNVPTLLQPSEPVDFYDDPYRPNVLIGIIIRVGVTKRPSNISSQAILGGPSTSSALNKLTSRTNDFDTPPGSPKSKKNRQTISTQKANEIDIDAIIKAPIVAKSQKASAAAPFSKLDDEGDDEPYSPGGSSDDDLPLLPVKVPNNMDHIQAAEDELKRKMEEINRQIAAQEMEIAGLLTGEPTAFSSASGSTSNVLANISIPSNLSQILASIKTTGKDHSIIPPPPPLIGSLLKTPLTTTSEEYNPSETTGSTQEEKNTATESNVNSTSLLAKLSDAELLSMVPDDIAIAPNKPTRYEEPPPPGV